ncbi:MAG TPA: rhodanese-like domain-containing protein [Polyangia bacterium]|jgi:rhodanese-related sulfurtransferase|nr:rhodanese-like domain-containing protein [Polyangia bacterium]
MHLKQFDLDSLDPVLHLAGAAGAASDLRCGRRAGVGLTAAARSGLLIDAWNEEASWTKPAALAPGEASWLLRRGALVLDVRSPEAFGQGHVGGSLHVSLNGQFVIWAALLVPPPTGVGVVLMADSLQAVDKAVLRLGQVGIEDVRGYVAGGIEAWEDAGLEVESLPQLSVGALYEQLQEGSDFFVLDVRRAEEYEAGHIEGSLHVPLMELGERLGRLDPRRPIAAVCARGYQSSTAISLLARHGFPKLFNVAGGMMGWAGAGYPLVRQAVPHCTMKLAG